MSAKIESGRGLRKFFDHVRAAKIQRFYDEYYTRALASQAHSELCRLLYGRDLCQHGMLDMGQLHTLIEVARPRQGSRVLELGCGAGLIAEYISDETQCRMTGIDISPAAIEQARARTAAKSERLSYEVKDIERLDYPDHSFDAVMSIDTLYYVEGLENVMRGIARVLKPGGAMYLFFHVHPDVGQGSEAASRSPLGAALEGLGLAHSTIDLSRENREHWEKRREVLLGLKEQFEEEDNMLLYDTRMDEYSQGFGEYQRFLYVVEGREGGVP